MGFAVSLLMTPGIANAQTGATLSCGAVRFDGMSRALDRVRDASFAEIARKDIRIGAFHGSADYLQTRFHVGRFFLPVPMRYYIEVNPALFDRAAPEAAVCAMLAHELGHAAELGRGSRLRVFGLIRMLSKRYTARFERRTDLVAIERGYAEGLIAYRNWVYANIPASAAAQKRRNYFAPDEIEVIARHLREDPKLAERWRRNPPRDLDQAKTQ